MKSDATPQRLYLMRVATISAGDQSAPVPCYLIQLGDGTNVLIDSGFPADVQSDAEMQVEVDKDVVAHLADLGLRPGDIDIVICTHLDPDHAGQHAAFAHAEFVVQREHYELARSGDERFGYVRQQWDDPALRYRLVDGDTALLPGVELIASGGHVPGHQSVLVRLPGTGPVLLAIDAMPFDMAPFTPENRPVNPYDMDEAATRASTRKLLDLAAREGVTLTVYGHDATQWQGLKTAPAYYE
jgi:N-acyl homoserine lactone hydrolase